MQDPAAPNSIFASHSREFTTNRYVYPVLSRRAGGLSIGVNLNPDLFCSFNCVYCQIDRSIPGDKTPVDVSVLAAELDHMAEMVVSGEIYRRAQFRNTPEALRRLNDFAFSGNGEPTACPVFDKAVEAAAEVRRRYKLDEAKLVLITNATLLHQPRVRQALETLDANNGEIWAKLDAGTEEYYRAVDRSAVPWQRILDNLREAAIARPIVVQSLFLRMHGESPTVAELDAYCDRLSEIASAGGHIKLVQVHTIARRPAETWASPLGNAEVDSIVALVQHRTRLPVAGFYGEGARG
jgi:wyosine [tRNA(Phe)-imidazoG37] synthetase (radical SAM superfamily)